jgi:cleavage and polyadenylation specificity factor subunit 3
MGRLKSKLLSLNANKTHKVKVYSPRNCEELLIPFKSDKTAKVVGKLASIPPPRELAPDADPTDPSVAHLVNGVLVQNDFKLSLMAPEDLREYAGLNTTTITCKQRLTLSAAGVELVKWALEGTFGTVEELPEMRRAKEAEANGTAIEETPEAIKPEDYDDDDDYNPEELEAADEEVAKLVAAYLVMGCVTVRYRTNGEVELEWEGNMLNDGIADSVMAVLFSVESSPAAVKRSGANGHAHSHSHSHTPLPDTNPHSHLSAEDRLERLMWFLEAQFGADNVSPIPTPKLAALPTPAPSDDDDDDADAAAESMDVDKEVDDAPQGSQEERETKEIERLHKLGIPVPGVKVSVDKMSASIWLEDLEVESNNKVFADRVRAVVERAVEVTAPLWG